MLFFFANVNTTVSQIDKVYDANVQLNHLRDTLERVQDSMFQFLNTNNRNALENYYIYEREFREGLEELNQDILGSPIAIMEKNIRAISETYLEHTNAAIEAKRGRNVSLYREHHLSTVTYFQFINESINSLNDMNFRVNSQNYNILRASLNSMMIVGVIFLVLIILLVVLWILLMTRRITEPLIQIAHAADHVAEGNLEVEFPYLPQRDELGTVAKACNKMLVSIRENITHIKENMIRESEMKENEFAMQNQLKDAQLKYLQAQINPHFLFNTLNAGVQLAMMEGGEKTSMFLENVADFFRYNVKKMGEDTTIANEISLVDNYVYILNVRFQNEISFLKTIDPRVISTRMPSMVLQPIIENAINHGVMSVDGEWKVELQIMRDDDRILIRILDNGVGIDDEVRERIMLGRPMEDRTTSTGLGMENVISRLRSYYERDDVFVIRKREDTKGTEVILYLYP